MVHPETGMDWFYDALDLVLHLDKHLAELSAQFGAWSYVLIALVVFCETGLVVTPILPGDSLLFAVGALSASGAFDVVLVSITLIVAAVLGDAVNYACGVYVGPKVFRSEGNWLFKRDHLERTRLFYERHGGKTIVLARFMPIIRTFAPFVAGIGRMPYPRFFVYNVAGGVAWVVIFVGAGYAFGNIPAVRDNFIFVAVGIVIVSLLPLAMEWRRARRDKHRAIEAA
jgi:membrane-associated protein